MKTNIEFVMDIHDLIDKYSAEIKKLRNLGRRRPPRMKRAINHKIATYKKVIADLKEL